VVGFGDRAHHAGLARAVLADRIVRTSVDETSGECLRRQAAWYHKRHPTFADALALVRKELWAHATFYGSPAEADTIKVPRDFMERLTEAVCYAA
jgi:hypothetical protein